MRRLARLTWGIVAALALTAGACTVDDNLIENKLCDRNAPAVNQQCIKGYTPTVRDGKCICVPVQGATPSPDV